jgi:hypothetical protein
MYTRPSTDGPSFVIVGQIEDSTDAEPKTGKAAARRPLARGVFGIDPDDHRVPVLLYKPLRICDVIPAQERGLVIVFVKKSKYFLQTCFVPWK